MTTAPSQEVPPSTESQWQLFKSPDERNEWASPSGWISVAWVNHLNSLYRGESLNRMLSWQGSWWVQTHPEGVQQDPVWLTQPLTALLSSTGPPQIRGQAPFWEDNFHSPGIIHMLQSHHELQRERAESKCLMRFPKSCHDFTANVRPQAVTSLGELLLFSF